MQDIINKNNVKYKGAAPLYVLTFSIIIVNKKTSIAMNTANINAVNTNDKIFLPILDLSPNSNNLKSFTKIFNIELSSKFV